MIPRDQSGVWGGGVGGDGSKAFTFRQRSRNEINTSRHARIFSFRTQWAASVQTECLCQPRWDSMRSWILAVRHCRLDADANIRLDNWATDRVWRREQTWDTIRMAAVTSYTVGYRSVVEKTSDRSRRKLVVKTVRLPKRGQSRPFVDTLRTRAVGSKAEDANRTLS